MSTDGEDAMIWNVQLVFDCADPDEIMAFWGRALEYRNDRVGLSVGQLREWRKDYPQFDGRGRIDDDEARRIPIYIQRVPEQKVGRNRVRLEIAVSSGAVDDTIEALCALGASRDDDGTGLCDVEGNELAVVGGLERPDVRRVLRSVVFDCLDPDRMLAFWSEALGYPASADRCDPVPGSSLIRDGSLVVHGQRVDDARARWAVGGVDPSTLTDRQVLDLTPGLAFGRTDRPKTAKNRFHLDLRSTDADADRARLEALGATVQRWDTDRVLLDPEGNELCLG